MCRGSRSTSRSATARERRTISRGQLVGGSSVFAIPEREKFDAPFAEGGGISAQAHALGERIRHVTALAAADSRFCEVHPELCFTAMNDMRRLKFRKKSAGGAFERLGLLRRHGINIDPGTLGGAATIPLDDVLDAAACAWTAARRDAVPPARPARAAGRATRSQSGTSAVTGSGGSRATVADQTMLVANLSSSGSLRPMEMSCPLPTARRAPARSTARGSLRASHRLPAPCSSPSRSSTCGTTVARRTGSSLAAAVAAMLVLAVGAGTVALAAGVDSDPAAPCLLRARRRPRWTSTGAPARRSRRSCSCRCSGLRSTAPARSCSPGFSVPSPSSSFPIVWLGAPGYPPEEWQTPTMWMITAALVGTVVHDFVRDMQSRAAHIKCGQLGRADALPSRAAWDERLPQESPVPVVRNGRSPWRCSCSTASVTCGTVVATQRPTSCSARRCSRGPASFVAPT